MKHPYGRPVTKNKVVTVERNGLIGHWLDKLIGEKTVVKNKICYTDGITSHTEKLIEMIENQKSEIQTKKAKELDNIK